MATRTQSTLAGVSAGRFRRRNYGRSHGYLLDGQTVRQLRGRYGVFPRPRPPRARCGVCGLVAVVVDWVTGEGGSARPVRVARCRSCGDVTFPAGEAEAMTTNLENGDGQ